MFRRKYRSVRGVCRVLNKMISKYSSNAQNSLPDKISSNSMNNRNTKESISRFTSKLVSKGNSISDLDYI